jgi:hypothetical protein
MGATNDHDRQRIVLEDAIACELCARRHLWTVMIRMVQAMRTREEKRNVDELKVAYHVLTEQHSYLTKFHPDRLEER